MADAPRSARSPSETGRPPDALLCDALWDAARHLERDLPITANQVREAAKRLRALASPSADASPSALHGEGAERTRTECEGPEWCGVCDLCTERAMQEADVAPTPAADPAPRAPTEAERRRIAGLALTLALNGNQTAALQALFADLLAARLLAPAAGPEDGISQVRYNAERDPSYRPHCLACRTMARMSLVEPMFWRCASCGAEHDERRSGAPAGSGARGEEDVLAHQTAFADPAVSIAQKVRWLLGSAAEYEHESEDATREAFYRRQTEERRLALIHYVEGLERAARLVPTADARRATPDELRAAYEEGWTEGRGVGIGEHSDRGYEQRQAEARTAAGDWQESNARKVFVVAADARRVAGEGALAVSSPPEDSRFDTGDPEMDAALAADDAKLDAMGAYNPAPAVLPETQQGEARVQCPHGESSPDYCTHCRRQEAT